MPLISIVIANYNYGRFLEAAIKSVVHQDGFDKCELIVVDGGSNDNSVDVIKAYSNKVAWWVSERDKGQSEAFNKGFSHASGRYGCWLNADDILMPKALKRVIDYLLAHPNCEWLAGSTVFADAQLNVWKCSRCVKVWSFLGRFAPAAIVNGPSSFFLLENLRAVGGFDNNAHYVMDIDLWRRFLQRGIRPQYLKEYIWCFRLHEESKTASTITEHRVKNRTTEEADLINLRYGATKRIRKISEWINRCQRLLAGAYLLSYLDTYRFRGRNCLEVS